MKYGLIGESLGQSHSPRIHALFGNPDYELLEIKEEDLPAFFEKRDFKGINVTKPYKIKCMDYLDEISPEAARIGCVNTILNEDGKLIGFNTDYFGLKELIDYNGIEIEDRRVLILGTGATAKTARTACEDLGATGIHMLGRTSGTPMPDASVIINTTPVGTWPDIFEHVDVSQCSVAEAVVDAVYNPLRPDLVIWAQKMGMKAVGGLYMLVSQASYSHEIFTGEKISREKASEVYGQILFENENIVLTGMPSSGKTTVGKMVADALGMDFVDTDALTGEIAGKKVPDLIKEDGEEVFRAFEAEAVKKASALSHTVIATGGGVVLFEENMENLRKNGRIFFLDKPLELLFPSEDRPLSSDSASLEKLYRERHDIYMETCDSLICAEGADEFTALAVENDFHDYILYAESGYI